MDRCKGVAPVLSGILLTSAAKSRDEAVNSEENCWKYSQCTCTGYGCNDYDGNEYRKQGHHGGSTLSRISWHSAQSHVRPIEPQQSSAPVGGVLTSLHENIVEFRIDGNPSRKLRPRAPI